MKEIELIVEPPHFGGLLILLSKPAFVMCVFKFEANRAQSRLILPGRQTIDINATSAMSSISLFTEN